ncbi:glycosyltransferase [Vagococcus salmoninarum]|uniref:glycosyltransferase n=1 Tax=Vagococcus salmoninarum TaxID=2739 RepID=UPI003F9EB1D3
MKFGILGFNIFAPGGTTRSNLNLINEIKYDEDEIRYYNYLPFSKSDTIHFLVENNLNIEDLEFENYTSIEKDTDIDVYIITRESFFPIAKLIRSVSPNSKIIGEIHGPIDLLELNIKPHLKYFDALRVSTPSIKHRTMKEFNFDRIIDYPVSLRHLEFEEKVPEYTKNLLVHSRFTENPKDISYSIKLIEYLVNYLGRKDIHLYINGYGEGETLYRTLIKYYQLQDNVHINENVNEYIYISTSRYETLGYSIMEAISSNKKVLLFPGDDNVLGEIYQGFELVSWLDKNVANDAQTVLECIEQQN